MSLLDGLLIGRSAISTAQAGVELTGHNISNVNTPGFHRRRLLTSPIAPPPGLGGGVRLDGAARVADGLLARRVAASLAEEGRTGTRETLLAQLSRSAGDVSDSGVGAAIGGLFSSFSALATSPEDGAARGRVLTAAQKVADTFNRVAGELETIAAGADRDLAAALPELNLKAAKIAALNSQITQAEAGGQEASDLRDQRDQLVSELASAAGATSFVDGSGKVTVLVGGLTLVQADHAATLQATPDAALGGRNRLELVDGPERFDLTARVTSGSLGGLLSVRDQAVPAAKARLDQLAYDLAAQVNGQHQLGFGLDGVGGRSLFQPLATVTGAAAALSLRAGITADQIAASSTAAGVPGNGENAITLAGLASASVAAGNTATFATEAGGLAAQVGSDAAKASEEATIGSDQLTYLQTLQASSEGVSLDEEMTQLVAYQRAYQAGARVLTVIDGLLGELMKL